MCTPAGKFDTVTIPANYQEPQRNINPESLDVFYFRFLFLDNTHEARRSIKNLMKINQNGGEISTRNVYEHNGNG